MIVPLRFSSILISIYHRFEDSRLLKNYLFVQRVVNSFSFPSLQYSVGLNCVGLKLNASGKSHGMQPTESGWFRATFNARPPAQPHARLCLLADQRKRIVGDAHPASTR